VARRIIVNPDVLVGKPILEGTRISVEFVISLLADGWTQEDIVRNHPHLKPEDIISCLKYAAEMLQAEKVYPLPTTKVA